MWFEYARRRYLNQNELKNELLKMRTITKSQKHRLGTHGLDFFQCGLSLRLCVAQIPIYKFGLSVCLFPINVETAEPKTERTENPRNFFNVYNENMFIIEIEDGRKAP